MRQCWGFPNLSAMEHQKKNEPEVSCVLEVQPTAPHFVLPIFDELGVVLVLCLEVLETTPENEHLVRLVFALHLQEPTRLGVYLHEGVTLQME